jgi:hypothetical protein
MAMTYTSLTAAKGTSGAIATWVNYTLLDVPVVVDEAQSVLFTEGRLRCREMLTDMVFTMPINSSYQPLPTGFLDPIGRIQTSSFNSSIRHKDANYINRNRNYTETTGTLGTNPFTTVNLSLTVSVNLPNHGFTQDSIFNVTGATAFNNVTLNGTFPINAIVDANNFTIDITSLGQIPNAGGSGGGATVTYLCDSLTPGTPYFFGIYNERVNFEQAFFQATICRLQYYQQPALLSATNTTNFLTNRYPKLLRLSCMCAAAEFMKDDTEYQKWLTRLQGAIEAVAVQDDMSLRGVELDPEIP